MSKKILSPFGFYGGKSKMATTICDMIDYNNTDIYIEPFGGACRVLLNKKTHKQEIYNDFGYGLATFFETLSNPELADEVISILYDIVPSQEVFEEMRLYKIEHEQELTAFMKEQFKRIVWDLYKRYNHRELKCLHKAINQREYKRISCCIKEINDKNLITDNSDVKLFTLYANMYVQYWDLVNETYSKAYSSEYNNCDIEDDKVRHCYAHSVALEAIENYTSDVLNSNISAIDTDPIKMAVATFVTYELSRDGMGIYYSKSNSKFKSYYNSVGRLKDVADRFENVCVTQVDALTLIQQYCDYENAMLYLDPSYLNDNDTDLGKNVYARSYAVEEHKILAETICNAKAKIILSNYDVEPYNTYLSEENGWRKFCYGTKTSVGSKKDNKRTEVLWCNY